MPVTDQRFSVSTPLTIDGHQVDVGHYAGYVADRPSVNHEGGRRMTYHMEIPFPIEQQGAIMMSVKSIEVTEEVICGKIESV